MTLEDLTQLVLDQKRDQTDNFVDTTEITRYFNQFARRLNSEMDLDFTQTSAAISYVDGTTNYKLSVIGNGDIKALIEMFYTNKHYFEYVTPQDFDFLKDTSVDVWAMNNKDLLIKTSFGTGTLSCSYYSTYMAKTSGGSWTAALSASTDEPLMDEQFQDSYVEYALSRIYKKEGATDDLQESREELEQLKKDMRSEYVSRRQSERKRFGHVADAERNRSALYAPKSNPLNQ